MYADSPTTMAAHRLCRWLFYAVLMLGCASARGETYQARGESLHTFFSALSLPLGLPVVVSRAAARQRVDGTYDFSRAQQVLEAVAEQHHLIWYSDGQVLYLYAADEAKSSAVTLRHISVSRLREFMRRSGLDESRYPLRESGGRMFYVSGPANYVDQVLHLTQLMDRQRAALRVGQQAFGVVQVLNTHVADREYVMGEKKVNVPGMASLIETVLSREQQAPAQRPPGLLADKSLAVIPYPDTNSLLIKGKPAQVRFIEQLVAELDVPKRAIEVSLWLVDVDRDELKKIDQAWAEETHTSTSATRVLEPLEDNRLMAQIAMLERRRRARVVTLPVILTQENVPAVFQDNHTLYVPGPAAARTDWKPIRYGTQVSALPRFAEANEIEMLLSLEDDRQMGEAGRRQKMTAVGRVSVSSVVRMPQGKRLWLGGFRRDVDAQGRATAPGQRAEVRLFVIQARALGNELKTLDGTVGPPPLTQPQYERVQRAFVRSIRDVDQ